MKMTKEQIIAKLKKEYPTLSKAIDDKVEEMSEEEYQSTISDWADILINEEIKALNEKNKATQKAALLDRLGITEEEAKLLLG